MCGIAGWVSFDGDLTRRSEAIDAMTETMACRGPDGRGTFVRTHVGLGHRRLAVIDLPGGAQPMTVATSNGEVALVYSGEAYNFHQLRNRLAALGQTFTTDSDTEVVLRAYLQWGDGLVDELNGMYAFAIWDQRDEKLVMVRDRMGVKPFYYYPTPDGVLFGSEPKAILANPLARKAVELDGLREVFAYTKPPGWALWKGMAEVLPGTVMTVDRKGIRKRTYWKLTPAEHHDSLNDTVDRVRHLLTDTVRRQLISDVPQGVLLSGGLDSSAITGLAAQELARKGERVRTFSVDFIDQEKNFVPDEMHDTPDSPYVRDVATLVQSVHQDVMLNPAELSDVSVRQAVIGARDIPVTFGDLDSSLYLLFRAIREHSTVALSGESADEVFGGYSWFHDDSVHAKTFPWLPAFRQYLGSADSILRPELRERVALDDYIADQYATAIAEVEHLDGESEVEYRMRTICHMSLTRFVRQLLDRKDRMSMAVGLEVRVPFCDHRLVEYMYNVPWAMKSFDGREKSLLRAAAKHVLPGSVAERVKSAFPSTQDATYIGNLQQQMKERLAEPDSPIFTLADRERVEHAVALDPTRMPFPTRAGLERTIALATWLELNTPELLL